MRRFRRPLADYFAYSRGVLALAVAQVGIGLNRIPACAAMLGVQAPSTGRASTSPTEPELCRATRVAKRLASAMGPKNYCLRHSLVLGHLLRAHHPTLHFGVRRQRRATQGHAWIEVGGLQLGLSSSDGDAGFIPLGRPS